MDIETLAKEAGLKLSNGSYWTNVSGTTADLHKFCDLVEAATRKKCWNEINAFIKTGELPGNGCDESAQRNGLVLASNIVSSGMRPNV